MKKHFYWNFSLNPVEFPWFENFSLSSFKSAACRMEWFSNNYIAGMCRSGNRSEIAQVAERPSSNTLIGWSRDPFLTRSYFRIVVLNYSVCYFSYFYLNYGWKKNHKWKFQKRLVTFSVYNIKFIWNFKIVSPDGINILCASQKLLGWMS